MPYKKRKMHSDGNHAFGPRTSLPLEISIYSLVILTPLALGTVHVSTTSVMLMISILSFVLLLIRTKKRSAPFRIFPMGLVLLITCAWTLFQVIPLPMWLVKVISPSAWDVYDKVLSGTKLAGQWRPVSLSPPSTVMQLMKLLAVSFVFLVVVNYFRDRHRARRLLKIVAWSGLVVALIGFFSKLFMIKNILGFYPLPRTGDFFFSTFINPNHLSGFLLLCAPVSLGLSLSGRSRQDRALFGFMALIMGVGVFMSLSRGGMVALIAAFCFLLVFASTRKSRRLRHAAIVQAITAAVLVVAGYLAYDSIISELRSVGDINAVEEEVKIQSWAAVGPMIADHAITGIGKGAYATVYPRYKTLLNNSTFTHAENETLQYLADYGIVVGGLFILTLLGSFILSLKRAKTSFSMGGVLAGLFGCLLQNQVDFSLETGAVMLVFFTLLGVAVAAPLYRAGRPTKFEMKWRISKFGSWGLVGFALVLSIAGTWYASRYELHKLTGKLQKLEETRIPAEPYDGSKLGNTAGVLMDHHPSDYFPELVLARAYLRGISPNIKKAIHWLSVSMFLNPTEPQVHRMAARALFLAGVTKQAVIEYRLAAKYDPTLLSTTSKEVLALSGDTDLVIEATPKNESSLLMISNIMRRKGKKKAAMKAARMAFEKNSSSLKALDLLSSLAFDAGNFKEAQDFAHQAVNVDPQHDFGWIMQARIFSRQGNLKKSEEVLKQGWSHIPDSTNIAYKMVDLYLRDKRYKEAQDVASQMRSFVSSDDRSQASLLMLLGRIKEARQMYFDARKYYQEACQLRPSYLPYLYRLGFMEEKLGAWDQAESIYQRLKDQKFKEDEMEEKIDLVQRARKIEQDKAMWKKYIEPEEKKEKNLQP